MGTRSEMEWESSPADPAGRAEADSRRMKGVILHEQTKLDIQGLSPRMDYKAGVPAACPRRSILTRRVRLSGVSGVRGASYGRQTTFANRRVLVRLRQGGWSRVLLRPGP